MYFVEINESSSLHVNPFHKGRSGVQIGIADEKEERISEEK